MKHMVVNPIWVLNYMKSPSTADKTPLYFYNAAFIPRFIRCKHPCKWQPSRQIL